MRCKNYLEWNVVDLKCVAEYVNTKIDINFASKDTYISTTNMIPNKGGIEPAISLPKANKLNSFKKGDILISNIRPYFKKIWFATFDGTSSGDVLIIRSQENIDSKYLYYTLSNDYFFEYSTKSATGTKMPRGDKRVIMQYPVAKLDFLEQKAIAEMLSAFDEKIELNNQINEKLEKQAQEIFKHWFVNFEFPNENGMPYKSSGGEMVKPDLEKIPKGWEVKKLGQYLKVELGGTPARKNLSYWGGNINWINSGELNNYRIIHETEKITEKGLNNSSTKLWEKGTTVVAITGATLGKTSLLLIDTCANQSVVGIKENKKMPYTYIYPYVLTQIPTLVGQQTGGAQQHINKGNFEDLNLLIPNKEILESYHINVVNHYKMIEINEKENQILINLRDTLLPKLMSGEIRIPLD